MTSTELVGPLPTVRFRGGPRPKLSYAEAERLLVKAGVYTARDGDAVALIQRAQVHASLAIAASQLGPSPLRPLPSDRG